MPPGGWTDDTSMMLALMDGYLANGRLIPKVVAKNFFDWFEHGAFSHTGSRFDIGNTTRKALERFAIDGNPIAGSDDPNASGNGGIMRLAPAVIANHRDLDSAIADARLQSSITHASTKCLDIAQKMAQVIFDGSLGRLPDSDLHALSQLTWNDLTAEGDVGSTWTCATWCVSNTQSFEDALVLAVNRRNDADTVGAVTGQIAGSKYGISGIPQRWLKPLLWKDLIVNKAQELYSLGNLSS